MATDIDENQGAEENNAVPDKLSAPQPSAQIYPELSPRYMVLLKWMALIFVGFVLWAVFNSGYS